MPGFFNRLGWKLAGATVVFLLVLAVTAGLLVTFGFRHAQEEATRRSAQGLEAQGREMLGMVAHLEAASSDASLLEAAEIGTYVARYIVDFGRIGTLDQPVTTLVRGPNGQYYDPNPSRRTEIFIPNFVPIDERITRELQETAPLDALLPGMMARYTDAAAIYMITPHGLTRYYPVTGLPYILPPDYNIFGDPSFTMAAPEANPGRQVVWRPPYTDPGGQGLLVTASIPVYDDDTFRGVVGVDISLTRLISQLSELKPTPGSYAFLIGPDGKLIAAPPYALTELAGADAAPAASSLTEMIKIDLTQSPNVALQEVLQAMRARGNGVTMIELAGRPVFLAYAPLPEVGWSLGLVAPISEITAQSEAVADAIRADADETINASLLITVLMFLLAVIGNWMFSQWLLTQRIDILVEGTHAITSGDLGKTIPVQSHDELGQLAESFNHMSTELAAARKRLEGQADELAHANRELLEKEQLLEQRVLERTRELSTLLTISRNVALTLELRPLLRLILDHLKQVVNHDAAELWVLEGGVELRLLYHKSPFLQLSARRSVGAMGDVWKKICDGLPVIISDVHAQEPIADAWRQMMLATPERLSDQSQTWMGVPLIAREQVLGLLAVEYSQAGYYTRHHASLMLAFASQAAVAIENARLYEAAQGKAALEERQKLARELHDSVSQALYGIVLGTRTARALLDRDPAQVAKPLEYVQSLAEGGMAEMRALIFELRPESLEQEGLVAALSKQAATLRARYEIIVDSELGNEPDVPLEVKDALYRIAQEALHNVIKHARASHVNLRLMLVEYPSDPAIILTISDNGIGFDPDGSFPGHLGLISMRERADRLGGHLILQSTPEHGVSIQVEIPLWLSSDGVYHRQSGNTFQYHG